MLAVDNPLDLKAHVGEELEPSDWVTIDHVLASLVEDKDVSRWPVSGVFSSDDATKGQFRDG